MGGLSLKEPSRAPGERATATGDGSGNRAGSGRATLGTCCLTHFLHDGFSDALYVLLPVWQAEFAFSLTQVGLVKSVFSGSLAAFQIPLGLLAERWGERGPVVAGTVVAGIAFAALGLAGGAVVLVPVLVLVGLGAAVQHPLCSSMVSNAYEGGARRSALGIYNFSGDLGKVVMPGLAALVAGALGWRWATGGIGVLCALAAGGIWVALVGLGIGARPSQARRRRQPGPGDGGGWGIHEGRGFRVLAAIAVLDFAVRTAFLTFVPFLLIAKGAGVETVGLALALVFGGGALGKFLCGVLAGRLGIVRTVIISELITGVGIVLLLPLPLAASLVLLPVIGLGLNGTSSVLYGTVAEFVTAHRRARVFGLFYTIGIGSGALSPIVFGILSDLAGVPATLAMVAAMALATIPLARLLRKPLARVSAASGRSEQDLPA